MSKIRCVVKNALFITKINNHHFEIFLSFRNNFITSITSIKVAFFIDLKTNKIFVILFFALKRESLIARINCRLNAFDVKISEIR